MKVSSEIKKTKRLIDRLNGKIADLQYQANVAQEALFKMCDHPLDDIVFAHCYDSCGDHLPPMRVCTICGLGEEGWGCGFKKLRGYQPDSSFQHITEKEARNLVRKFIRQPR